MTSGQSREGGPGRLLAVVYAVFALAAGARSGVQLATKFDEARLAYLLSAAAAALYLVAAVVVSRPSALSWRVAVAALTVELLGVLVVGTASLVASDRFPDATVWSGYGVGYGLIPLVLPVVGLWWLLRNSPVGTDSQGRTREWRR